MEGLNTVAALWLLGAVLGLGGTLLQVWVNLGMHEKSLFSRLVLVVVPILYSSFWAFSELKGAAFDLWVATGLLALFTLAVGFGVTLILVGEGRLLTSKFGKVWVKWMDFPYLAIAFLGVVRLLGNSPHLRGGQIDLESWGFVAVCSALGIRLSKALIESFFDEHIAVPMDRRTL